MSGTIDLKNDPLDPLIDPWMALSPATPSVVPNHSSLSSLSIHARTIYVLLVSPFYIASYRITSYHTSHHVTRRVERSWEMRKACYGRAFSTAKTQKAHIMWELGGLMTVAAGLLSDVTRCGVSCVISL